MPRKKLVDPLVTVLDFFETEPEETCRIAHRIIGRNLARRFPPTVVEKKAIVRRRRRQEPVPVAVIDQEKFLAPTTTSGPNSTAPVPVASKPRKRRMRADSPRPASEATPIVPQQAEVGEEERAARAAQVDEAENELEAYTGQ